MGPRDWLREQGIMPPSQLSHEQGLLARELTGALPDWPAPDEIETQEMPAVAPGADITERPTGALDGTPLAPTSADELIDQPTVGLPAMVPPDITETPTRRL